MNAPLPASALASLPPALDEVRAHEAEMVAMRHRIHQNPELAYEENATADLVAASLARWGYEVHRGLGITGVVGTLKVGTSTKCDAMFGMHNMPGRPLGKFAAVPGHALASSDSACIKVRGTGGHGAMPHHATDSVVAASAIVMALQTIVSRNVPPLQMGIVTVGAFLAGDAPNVIPGEAELRLTVRAFKPDVRDLLEKRITEIAQQQAAVFGCTAEVKYDRRYPMLYNHPKETEFCRQVLEDWLGPVGILDAEPVTGSEDFSFFLEKVPGCYVFIGNGEGSEGGCMVHNPGYDFNDAALSTGASYWVKLAETWLEKAA